MSHPLVHRSRQLKSAQVVATRQLIVFPLRQDQFALPIQVAQKVISIDNLYGQSPDFDTGLVLYQNQDIPVIDIERRIFGHSAPQKLLPGHSNSSTRSSAYSIAQRYLLIIQNLQGESVGLPIVTQPMLRRVPESAFAPLSSTYVTDGKIRCVSALVILAETEPPLFVLNLNQLFQPQAMLSG